MLKPVVRLRLRHQDGKNEGVHDLPFVAGTPSYLEPGQLILARDGLVVALL